jgi:polar amino acid transport system substrate-binding protein
MRRLITVAIAGTLLLAACGDDKAEDSGTASGGASSDPKACAEGKTLTAGTLTIATGEPAFPPYVMNDATPEDGEGFEAAIAMAVAKEMGFEATNVKWVRTAFDAAVAPGPKDFDFNLQQYTITADRAKVVSFSDPYYTAAQAVIGLVDSDVGTDVKKMKLGAAAGTTSVTYAEDTIKPESAVQVFNDNAAAKAALDAKQIDAIVADLPTALYLAAVEFENATVFGQIEGSGTDQFGLLMAKDNALVDCVNGALKKMKDSGELDKITVKWMSEFTEAPMLKLG